MATGYSPANPGTEIGRFPLVAAQTSRAVIADPSYAIHEKVEQHKSLVHFRPQTPRRRARAAPTESEPLLGRPGDATQKPDAPLFNNLPRPSALQPLLSRPLLQSLGVFAVLQAILLLQPTATPSAKRAGQRGHALLHLASLSLFAAGATVIQVNKHAHALPHFHSLHAYLGVGTLGLLLLQYAFGFTIWATPAVWGGEDKAKALWKVHRWVGYAALALLLATVAAAAETDYARDKWRVKLWAVLVAEGLIVAGVFPRVHLRKLGLRG
ncbi:hypothetical protein NEMBOFW57_009857 [Staphylotrichum longicolle]|uniref:Cytochrome b561 domain-containing protein n=1 Tax=Staphylotrichum longicolle TaxID=669026 RepID=A0AAD4EPR9_9PEZI|nr:hypothetical protein NEMBOFW57_009857 [Staphylotrichum longicolle]